MFSVGRLIGRNTGDKIPTNGLVCWLDATVASNLTVSGGKVVQANDISGNNNHFVTPYNGSGFRPDYDATLFNNRGGISFTKAGVYNLECTSLTSLAHNSYTCVHVGTRTYQGSQLNLLKDRLSATRIMAMGYGGALGNEKALNTSYQFPQGSVECLVFTNNGTTQANWWNGVKYPYLYNPGNMSSNSAAWSASIMLGGNNVGADWKTGVFMIYNRVLTDAEITRITRFYQKRFGYSATRGTQTYNIVFDGDSICQGQNSTSRPFHQVAMESVGLSLWNCWNTAKGGQTLQNIISGAAANVDPLYNSSLTSNKNIIVISCLANSCNTNLRTPTDIQNDIISYCASRRSAGFGKIVMQTCHDRNDTVLSNFQSNRASVNTWIRDNVGSGYYDAVADVGADSSMGDVGDADNTTYFVDKVHPNDTGHGVIAGYIATALSSVM
jgi:hypothetical protein